LPEKKCKTHLLEVGGWRVVHPRDGLKRSETITAGGSQL